MAINPLPATPNRDANSIVMSVDAGPVYTPSGVTPVTGSFTGTGQSATFTPGYGRGFNVSLWGTFSGIVQLERNLDGINWLPITASGYSYAAYSAPCSEIFEEDENGVLYRLNCASYTSGTINYRMSA